MDSSLWAGPRADPGWRIASTRSLVRLKDFTVEGAPLGEGTPLSTPNPSQQTCPWARLACPYFSPVWDPGPSAVSPHPPPRLVHSFYIHPLSTYCVPQ